MTWPNSDVPTSNIDASSDSPSAWRADGKTLTDTVNAMRSHVSAFMQTVLDDADASTARGTLGAAATGSVGSSGLTMSQNYVLGRTSLGGGAIEQLTAAQVSAVLGSAGGYASDTAPGVVELATNAEATTGSDAVRAVPPAGVKAAIEARLSTNMPGTIGAGGEGCGSSTNVARDDHIHPLVLPSTFGAIGTYVFAQYTSASFVSAGTTKAGSSLTASDVFNGGGGSTLSGTWRLMGQILNNSSATASVWLRIS